MSNTELLNAINTKLDALRTEVATLRTEVMNHLTTEQRAGRSTQVKKEGAPKKYNVASWLYEAFVENPARLQIFTDGIVEAPYNAGGARVEMPEDFLKLGDDNKIHKKFSAHVSKAVANDVTKAAWKSHILGLNTELVKQNPELAPKPRAKAAPKGAAKAAAAAATNKGVKNDIENSSDEANSTKIVQANNNAKARATKAAPKAAPRVVNTPAPSVDAARATPAPTHTEINRQLIDQLNASDSDDL